MSRAACRVGVVLVAVCLAEACALRPIAPVVTTPRYPAYPVPAIPEALGATAALRAQHDRAWQWLQSGDPRQASREFWRLLAGRPDFYPAETGLGFAYLADRQFKLAAESFNHALSRNDLYLPAWIGQAEAQIALSHDAEAIVAMNRILAIDPQQTAIQSRLDLVGFRQLQSLIEDGRRARLAGELDVARRLLAQALGRSPASTVILLELALTESAARAFDAAERYARRAVEAEPNEAEVHAALGGVLEAQGRYADAAAVFARVAALDPRPEWRVRSVELGQRAELAALPDDFGAIETATTLTRAQVAAFIGIKLKALVAGAPQRVSAVVTDVRSHWAAPWILPVTRAGIMDIFANHTFQPSATVQRSDLAQVAVELLSLAGTRQPTDLARWRAARPRFEDVSVSHLSYRSAALAVSAGAMGTHDGDRFDPIRPATGSDLAGVVRRVAELASH